MAKSKIYTGTGDKGTTSLVDGSRQPKNSVRIEAYGTVDELNSFIGMLIAAKPLELPTIEFLTSIQRSLFDIGSYLAAGSSEMATRLLPDLQEPVLLLEKEIDRIDATLPRHNRFILPQGTPSSAAAQVCRAVARRAERRILDLADLPHVEISADVLRYINRLSDYLFVLARYCNSIADFPETYWDPS